MCGIAGIMLFQKDRNESELAFIRELASNLAIENQQRGRDATGFAIFSKKRHSVLKHPVLAYKFVNSQLFKRYADKNINNDTKNILIHTRAGTKGSEKVNDNNHPIVTDKYIGIHNGMIRNDDKLFEEHMLPRKAQVDSEVIFRLLDAQGKNLTNEKIADVAKKLRGMFTFAFVQKGKPNVVHLVRHDNPVTLVYIEELNIIVFASQRRYIETALKDILKDYYMVGHIPFKCHWTEPDKDTIYRFDTSINNPAEQLAQKPTKFELDETKRFDFDSYSDDDWYYGTDGYTPNYRRELYEQFYKNRSTNIMDISDTGKTSGTLSLPPAKNTKV